MKPTSSGCANVSGIKLYHEICGGGEPLVLIHGGLTTIGEMRGWVQSLAKTWQVIAVEMQGHGRTAARLRAPAGASIRFQPGGALRVWPGTRPIRWPNSFDGMCLGLSRVPFALSLLKTIFSRRRMRRDAAESRKADGEISPGFDHKRMRLRLPPGKSDYRSAPIVYCRFAYWI
jgi:hypothetical protein